MSSDLIIKVQEIFYVVQFTMNFCVAILGVPRILFSFIFLCCNEWFQISLFIVKSVCVCYFNCYSRK
jgi:hypothetical protein